MTHEKLPCRGFLRALADEIDAQRGAGARDEMLRATGRRMARLLPLPPVASVDALAHEMNDALAGLGWGTVALALDVADRRLTILHSGLPRLGGAGEPPGMWLSAVLEGLYETWIAQQPGSDSRPRCPPRRGTGTRHRRAALWHALTRFRPYGDRPYGKPEPRACTCPPNSPRTARTCCMPRCVRRGWRRWSR